MPLRPEPLKLYLNETSHTYGRMTVSSGYDHRESEGQAMGRRSRPEQTDAIVRVRVPAAASVSMGQQGLFYRQCKGNMFSRYIDGA